MKYLYAALMLIWAGLLVSTVARAAEPDHGPVTRACWFVDATTAACKADRDEVENTLGRNHLACAEVIYIVYQGAVETVRCQSYGYKGDVIDYISSPDRAIEEIK